MSEIKVPAAEDWDAVYYPNPIPLSSRCLLACALLFDRLHFPGVSLPQRHFTDAEKREWSQVAASMTGDPELKANSNLVHWSFELHNLSDFVYLPDRIRELGTGQGKAFGFSDPLAGQLVDDTYGEGTSAQVVGVNAAFGMLTLPNDDSAKTMVLGWPMYQARALQYASANRLPLVSDDPLSQPPLPPHPKADIQTKHLAQQVAVEALRLALPTFKSVNPAEVAEFRSQVQHIVKPFRVEMVRLTVELHAAIAAGQTDGEILRLCKAVAEAKVLPAVRDLAKQLKEPLRPWHKIALDATETLLAAATATSLPHLAVAWAFFRGAKIASEYAVLAKDREGKRKSGLSLLLHLQRDAAEPAALSDWDRNDWRCSGFVKIVEPGARVYNTAFVELLERNGTPWTTARNLFQTQTRSVIWAGHGLESIGVKPTNQSQNTRQE